MLDKDGKLKPEYIKEELNVLKFEIQSQHTSRASYRCFIRYKPNRFGVSGVTHYACECANGRQTVGCCSHIAAIVYYLSHARYLSKILQPAQVLSEMFKKNHCTAVINDDSDDD